MAGGWGWDSSDTLYPIGSLPAERVDPRIGPLLRTFSSWELWSHLPPGFLSLPYPVRAMLLFDFASEESKRPPLLSLADSLKAAHYSPSQRQLGHISVSYFVPSDAGKSSSWQESLDF